MRISFLDVAAGIAAVGFFVKTMMVFERMRREDEDITQNAQVIEVMSADSSRKDTVVVIPFSAAKHFRARILPMVKEGKMTVVKQDKTVFQP